MYEPTLLSYIAARVISRLVISVGKSAQLLPRIFQPFWLIMNSRSRRGACILGRRASVGAPHVAGPRKGEVPPSGSPRVPPPPPGKADTVLKVEPRVQPAHEW